MSILIKALSKSKRTIKITAPMISRPILVHLGSMPKGYRKDGTPIGGARIGSGRKKKDLKKMSFKFAPETLELMQQLPMGRRYEICNQILIAGLKRYLKQGGAK
jgi:hypothetical protein